MTHPLAELTPEHLPPGTLLVRVVGEPAPQGSKRHVGGGRMVESSAKVAPWRETVAADVARAVGEQSFTPVDGPVAVTVLFTLARPVSTPKRVILPFRKPDLDKLLRSTLDALTMGGALVDDARVVALTARKLYATPGQPTGATIMVTNLDTLAAAL